MGKRGAIGALVLGSVFVALSACNLFESSALGELDDARELWRDSAVSSYTFSLHRSCFCPPESVGPVQITVTNGRVVERTLIATSIAVSDTARWPSMDGVFEYAERALRDADEVAIDYHPDFGFPVQINADWIRDAVDDEEYLTVMTFSRTDGR